MNRLALLACVTMCALIGCKKSGTASVQVMDVWKASAEGNMQAVRQHIADGTDINECFVQEGIPGSGGSPLHLAALTDQRDVAALLIENGASLENRAKDENNGTPLHWAAWAGNLDIVRLLVEAGAKVNSTDKNGYTPIDALAADPANRQAEKELIREFLRGRGGKSRGG